MLLTIVIWIVIGLLVGFIISKAVNLRGDDPRFGIGGAVIGSVIAAAAHLILTDRPIAGWDTWNAIWSTVGAIIGAITWHTIRSRSISHDIGTSRAGRLR